MFWFYEKNNVDNSPIFGVADKQYCTVKAIHSEEPKELRGNRTGTAVINWPKGYSIPYGIMQKEF